MAPIRRQTFPELDLPLPPAKLNNWGENEGLDVVLKLERQYPWACDGIVSIFLLGQVNPQASVLENASSAY